MGLRVGLDEGRGYPPAGDWHSRTTPDSSPRCFTGGFPWECRPPGAQAVRFAALPEPRLPVHASGVQAQSLARGIRGSRGDWRRLSRPPDFRRSWLALMLGPRFPPCRRADHERRRSTDTGNSYGADRPGGWRSLVSRLLAGINPCRDCTSSTVTTTQPGKRAAPFSCVGPGSKGPLIILSHVFNNIGINAGDRPQPLPSPYFHLISPVGFSAVSAAVMS